MCQAARSAIRHRQQLLHDRPHRCQLPRAGGPFGRGCQRDEEGQRGVQQLPLQAAPCAQQAQQHLHRPGRHHEAACAPAECQGMERIDGDIRMRLPACDHVQNGLQNLWRRRHGAQPLRLCERLGLHQRPVEAMHSLQLQRVAGVRVDQHRQHSGHRHLQPVCAAGGGSGQHARRAHVAPGMRLRRGARTRGSRVSPVRRSRGAAMFSWQG
mmetsp:Transcript_18503/g.48333  ORF Transcript_18503/g.48333 Transcript_18503/m.48333 type:complete len:211 (-) Transcript_18503:479-1111(-)